VDEGVEIPDLQPPLFPDMVPYLEAFWILSPRRKKLVGMGGVADDYISLVDIDAYFNIAKIMDIEERMDYLKFITIMDQEYLKFKQEEREKEKKKEDKKNARN
jgi:hypothetical protein